MSFQSNINKTEAVIGGALGVAKFGEKPNAPVEPTSPIEEIKESPKTNKMGKEYQKPNLQEPSLLDIRKAVHQMNPGVVKLVIRDSMVMTNQQQQDFMNRKAKIDKMRKEQMQSRLKGGKK